MPTKPEDITKVKAQQKKASALAFESKDLASGARTFEDQVMTGVRSARTARGVSSLESAVGYTTGQLATAPADIRGRLADVSPLQTDIITAGQTGQTLSTLATLGKVSEAREGTISGAIGAGTNKLLALADVKKAESERASAEANILVNQIQLQEAVEKRKFDEWEATQRLSLEERALDQKGAGGPSWLEQQIIGKKLDQFPEFSASEKNKISKSVALISDLQAVRDAIVGEDGEVPSSLGSLLNLTTGPIGGRIGSFGEAGATRQAIDTLRANYEKGAYGAALTETEIKRGKKWLIDPNIQERANVLRIDSLLGTKKNEVLASFQAGGFSDEQANQFMTTGELPASSLQDIMNFISGGNGDNPWRYTGLEEER